MGYGYTTLQNDTNGRDYNWSHPTTDEEKAVIWLDQAKVTVDYETNRSIGKWVVRRKKKKIGLSSF